MKHLLSILIIGLTFQLSAQPWGQLDSAFGADGIRWVYFGPDKKHIISGLAICPDDKIALSGTIMGEIFGNISLATARLYPDGKIDSTYTIDGLQLTSTEKSWCNGMAVQPDGKIVITGSTGNEDGKVVLVRYKVSGALDVSFNNTGIVKTNSSPGDDGAEDIALQPDGKIVVGGYSEGKFAIWRYLMDGSLDTTFGNGGMSMVAMGNGGFYVTAIAIQLDGKIMAGGFQKLSGTFQNFALARFMPDGSLDISLGYNGHLVYSFNPLWDAINDIAVQSDGKILALGSYSQGTWEPSTSILVRFNPNGSLDNTFGNNGVLIFGQGQLSEMSKMYASSLVIQPDGKILVAGTSQISAESLLFRFLPNGMLDAGTFGNQGNISIELPYFSGGEQLALQTDGKIVLATSSSLDVMGVYRSFVVVRLLSGLSVGVLDIEKVVRQFYIYPNPVTTETTLEYELTKNANVSLEVLDANGRLLHTFCSSVPRNEGKQYETIQLSPEWPGGIYLLRLSAGNSQTMIRIFKR